jgi:hypothetical protein
MHASLYHVPLTKASSSSTAHYYCYHQVLLLPTTDAAAIAATQHQRSNSRKLLYCMLLHVSEVVKVVSIEVLFAECFWCNRVSLLTSL